MDPGFLALLCVVIAASTSASLLNYAAYDDPIGIAALRQEINSLADELKKTKEESKQVNKRLGALTRQMMLQQLFVEERIRSDGQSGIKQTRNAAVGGTKAYNYNTHVGKRMVAIHDHSNNIRTVGMGEFIGILNGIEFRTRHNDFRLYMPSRSTGEYHKTEDIPFPDVPPEVRSKKSVIEKVNEMVEWFKAWKNEDHSKRDYRKYFKPVLCYLEGTWTRNSENIDEPFESDRHFVDANSWFELQEKIRFTSYTGRKDNLENFAYLPTTIMETVNETTAVFAQWNYRILCHPLKNYLPTNRLRIIDNLASRLTFKHTVEELLKSRAARFQVNSKDTDDWKDGRYKEKFVLLDKLMGEIPGMDNYPANVVDGALGQDAYSMDPEKAGQKLNAGYYHRWYKVQENGAMGIQTRRRGYSDPSLFVAMTTQPNVKAMKLNVCKGKGKRKRCTNYEQKVSYAIPLEIIYLTPLNKWNPHNLTNKEKDPKKTVNANGRNGGKTKDKAYDGVNSRIYYLTPNEFFAGTETHVDAADTTRGSVGVLDPNGKVRLVRASGTRIFLPYISGVGILRQRYPIMPIHVEGGTAWKEIRAVEDFLMESNTHARLFREKLSGHDGGGGSTDSGNMGGGTTAEEKNTDTTLETGVSTSALVLPHKHEVTLSEKEVQNLLARGNVTKVTSEASGHAHMITIAWHHRRGVFYIAICASTPKIKGKLAKKCKDRHPAILNGVLNA